MNNKRKREEMLSEKWMRELIVCPAKTNYETLPKPRFKKLITPDELDWGNEEPFPGFSEYRKYRRANESRHITPYEAKGIPKPQPKEEESIPEIKKKKSYERLEPIVIEKPEILVKVIEMHPEVGYINLNRLKMDPVNDYQPYHYTICNYDEIDQANYATISKNGIMEVYKGHADFLSSQRLMVEHQTIIKLLEIPLFLKFREWKAFMVWFKKIRRMKFIEAQRKLRKLLVFRTVFISENQDKETKN